ncbi:aspartate carbamoyltransferase catalytic subunit [Rhodothermus profundi]|uniref:Aspartate carbamoyltransferase n=1 Tax=Rhodothermus profundi TaxID=633813 RepID=A0A1M6QM38_9BACT|nr:aspartate carbamoyltransferase catalytic subunit [Rhodothermus profundi]SHK21097.1 aspartate carbamoyltransferase [Rhodothermus profundi]
MGTQTDTPFQGRLQHRHLLGLATYSAEEIQLILQTARQFREVLERPIRRVPTLRGVTVVNLFFEPSTRTRISFELAEKRLSADVVNFSAAGSSVVKGETLKDTARNLEAMKIDMVVIRHRSPGAAHFLTRCIEAVVINAGDGAHEHPTQALLDLLTISDHFPSFEGLNVSIIGDIAHSRVARSNIYGLKALGANVTLCGPRTLMPVGIEELGVRVTYRLEEALEGCDVAMALRLQLERQTAGLFPSLREYHERYGIKLEHLKRYPDLLVMHPGPVNRGVELASEVVDHERAIILDQVTNGVAVRMAVLYLLAGVPETVA